MTNPAKTEKYRCERCHMRQTEHIGGSCSDGQGQFERRDHPRQPFASQSFTGGQVDALSAIVKKLLAGNTDVMVIARKEDFQTAAGKILRMKQRVELMRNGKIEGRQR